MSIETAQSKVKGQRRKAPDAPAPAPVQRFSAPAGDLSADQQEALASCETALAEPQAFAAWLREQSTGMAGYPHDDHLHPLAGWLTANAGQQIAVRSASYRLAGDLHHVRPLPAWAFRFCEALREHQPAPRYENMARPITGIRALQLLAPALKGQAA